nr:flavodoxin family protein [Clostridia bacterium]
MKKVLIITASLRKGSNSDMLAEFFKNGAIAAGNCVETVSLKGKAIGFCKGCFACQKIGKCVINDDANEITDKIAAADVVVWATPIYYYEMSGQMKTMIDRANSLFSRERKFRDVYFLATADDASSSTPEGAIKGLEGWIKCMKGSRLAGSVFVGGIEAERAIEGNIGLQKAFELGKSV